MALRRARNNMKLATIDDIGKSIAADLKELFDNNNKIEDRRKELQPELKQVWDALEAGQTVNGCINKGEWAKFAKVTIRYCQYIVKNGSRKRSDRKKREPGSPLAEMHIGLGGVHLPAKPPDPKASKECK